MQSKTQQCKEQTGYVARLTDERMGVTTKYGENLTEGRTIAGFTPGGRGKENKPCVCNLAIGSEKMSRESRNSSGKSTICLTCGWVISASLPSRTSDQKPAPTMSVAWGYGKNNGPAHWRDEFKIADGKFQSPIDIQTQKTRYDQKLNDRPIMVNYKSENNMELENNGHSVKAQIKERSELKGGPLEGTYLLEQFHLHWGAENEKGSEHTIDGMQYDAELHLVHYNSKYGSFVKAADKKDGLAVFGFMVKVGKSHDGFEKISNDLKKVMKKGEKCTLTDKFDPSCLFSDLSTYWTYQGSLTTPPLYESVTWIVFQKALEISDEQMVALRLLQNSEGSNIVNNYRPPLPVGDRVVNCSFH